MAPQVSPVGIVSVSETVPVKLFNAVTVIVEVIDVLTVTAAGEVAEIPKSRMVKVAVGLWLTPPLVPVTVST